MKQFPGMMAGKKILYVHGFASSGQSGTVLKIREMLPEATVVAPDLPIHPAEAMEMLRRMCAEECPDLIIGTSMGGMYTEMLHGYHRIVVNPAFQMGDTILKNNMLGKVTFLNPRQDGLTEFMMTKKLQEEYRDITAQCFSGIGNDERQKVWGLFGLEDPTVHTYDLFADHYPQALHFHGEHRMNDSILLHAVVPVVRWIDDSQAERERPIVYIALEDTMERGGTLLPSMLKCYRMLIESYEVMIVAESPTNQPDYAAGVLRRVFEHLGPAAWGRVVMTNRKDLLYGDYLIDAQTRNRSCDFMGTRIDFGSDTFKTWDDVIEMFSRLGGQ